MNKLAQTYFRSVFNVTGVLVLLFFCFLMFELVRPYFSLDLNTDFLLTKFKVIHLKHWRYAFFIHVFTSLLVLIAGFTQFSRWILRSYPRVHRRMGMLYVVVILLFSGPSGMLMAFYANGGQVSKISFVLLAALWWIFTYLAYRTAVQKRFRIHGHFMLRSFALSLSAITLRIIMFLLGPLDWFSPSELYTLAACLSWTVNLVVAEAMIYFGYAHFLLRKPVSSGLA